MATGKSLQGASEGRTPTNREGGVVLPAPRRRRRPRRPRRPRARRRRVSAPTETQGGCSPCPPLPGPGCRGPGRSTTPGPCGPGWGAAGDVERVGPPVGWGHDRAPLHPSAFDSAGGGGSKFKFARGAPPGGAPGTEEVPPGPRPRPWLPHPVQLLAAAPGALLLGSRGSAHGDVGEQLVGALAGDTDLEEKPVALPLARWGSRGEDGPG